LTSHNVHVIIYLNRKKWNIGTGARKGLIEKSGVIPARSRHCKGEQIQEIPLEQFVLGRFGGVMIPKSGELPV